ncbi:MAG: hypoxanthine phosphoribosyltransferase [Oscillospiraceae bacterium]|jgi:hypoxanthine phosphoribosyltransferase|nr:hypoxanthine phosphoribosyltransferase [Oscillospiraceae bacterium]
MGERVREVLISQAEIEAIVTGLAARISRDYEGRQLILIGILKGAYVFLADLARALTIPCEVEFLRVSSYRNQSHPGELEVLTDLSMPLEQYDVLVVEDILDSGRTLSAMLRYLGEKKPRSLKLCAFLDKPSRRQTPLEADYVGREIPDAFVVGYGLDYAQRYRSLPYVGILDLGT